MQKQICYTAGELFRKQMLLSRNLTPLKSLANVARIVDKHATSMIKTQWGLAKVLTPNEVAAYNDSLKQLAKRELIAISK